MLVSSLAVDWPFGVGLRLYIGFAQAVDYDVGMDVACSIIAICMGADQSLMPRKISFCVFKSAARIFFDYDRIEFYDEDHSDDEDRYNTIGDTSAGRISQKAEGALIGNVDQFIGKVNEILFVVYTERVRIEESGTKTDVTRLISARMATEFERGLYYGKNE